MTGAQWHPSQLTSIELAILSAMAMYQQQVSQVKLLDMLRFAGIKAPDGKAIAQPLIKAGLEGLMRQQLVVLPPGAGYQFNDNQNNLQLEVFHYLLQNKRIPLWLTAVKQQLQKEHHYTGWREFNRSACRREMWFALLTADLALFEQWREEYNKAENDGERPTAICLLEQPAGRALFAQLSAPAQQQILAGTLQYCNWLLIDCQHSYQYALELLAAPTPQQLHLAELTCWQALLRGDQPQFARLLAFCAGQTQSLNFLKPTLQGDFATAVQLLESYLVQVKKETGKRKVVYTRMFGLLYVVVMLGHGTAESRKLALSQTTNSLKPLEANSYLLLQQLLKDNWQPAASDTYSPEFINSGVDSLFSTLTLFWSDALGHNHFKKRLVALRKQAQTAGYLWVVAELDDIAGAQFALPPLLPDWHQQQQLRPLRRALEKEENWQRALKALAELSPASQTAVAEHKPQRLAWLLIKDRYSFGIEPREQKQSAKGLWSKGRPVALKRLALEPETVDGLSTQDKKVAACIYKSFEGYYGSTSYELDTEAALSALIGHPAVFWSDAPDVPVDIAQAQIYLRLTEQAQHISLQLEPAGVVDSGRCWQQQTPTLIEVFQLTPAIKQVASIIGSNLLVPKAAKTQLVSAIEAIAPHLSIHSDLPELSAHLQSVSADPKLYAHLLPLRDGLRLQFLVRPLPEGNWFKPGKGSEHLVGEQQSAAIQTSRDLHAEQQMLNQVVSSCPALSEADFDGQEWTLDKPADCLEVLLQLKTIDDAQLQLVWPEGERFRLKSSRQLSDLKLNIKQQGDWFVADGELPLDEHKVLALKELIALAANSDSRFIQLADGDYLALTDSFRQRLAELAKLSEDHKTGLKMNALTAPLLAEFASEAGSLKADKAWREQVKKLDALADYTPELPTTLQAELRDYQQHGFQWLSKLAHWGVGACLADDMGLGKTIQTLALLLQRAPQGPALVVAPVSVAMNWQSEVLRFAPTLNARLYQQQRSLADLGAFDLVIVSYGMLQSDSERFSSQHWHTVVLDEAQVIKNDQTKRSQAAMALQADFKMIASGTPVENHLGELWNLFRFINPGLLGSKERFNQRFAGPIERGDKTARLLLKKLIQPFILRRTKTQVLSELPSRTEITLQVNLSSEELHIYEALRQQAVESLQNVAAADGQAIQVLAEITRLRRFCCHPQLVLADSKLPGSKLTVFAETVEELLDNKHKVLVFSQFVDHLAIVRRYLDEQKVRYQYLDGSTSPKDRKQRVDAFQAGDGDVFLISLKAGGTGLNLTAADYVIHLDPWWNPAVEDQASDRAHRMGQTRPVTIYRLVTSHTIEEKILALHAQKRDLADSLLEGGDIAGKLDTAQLLQLLKESH